MTLKPITEADKSSLDFLSGSIHYRSDTPDGSGVRLRRWVECGTTDPANVLLVRSVEP